MAKKQNVLNRFWHELKRRNVFKVLAMYAGSAFIIIQVEGSLAEPLNLPRWFGTLLVIILSAGFPVTAILAWIFDLTSSGIEKTGSADESGAEVVAAPPGRRRLKGSDIVMAVMAIVIIILAWPKIFKPDALKRLQSSGEKISVAVMPFQNMTNDTVFNIWQEGIQMSLISSLSNSEELEVRQENNINNLIKNNGVTEYASISTTFASAISKKLNSDIFIYGNIQKAGPKVRLNAQLIDTKTENVLKSFEISGPYREEKVFDLSDTLRKDVTDFLIISKLMKRYPGFQHGFTPPKSADALRYFIYGGDAYGRGDYSGAIDWGNKAFAADSGFNGATFMIENSYSQIDSSEQSRQWLVKNYKRRDRMSNFDRLYASWAYAFSFESPEEQIKYLRQLLDIDDQQADIHYLLGITYSIAKQYDEAIQEFLKAREIAIKWDRENRKTIEFSELGFAYRKAGRYSEVRRLLKKAEKAWKDHRYYPYVLQDQAVLSFAKKDSVTANKIIDKLIAYFKNKSYSEVETALSLGILYDKAGIPDKAEGYFRKALSLEPENPKSLSRVADFFINNNRNLIEVSDLMDKAMKLASSRTDYYTFLDTKGWALYKAGKYKEAMDILQKTWDEVPFRVYSIRSHYEEVKKAVEGQKQSMML